MILVTTAGKVGADTARLLRERGVPVRVLVRDPAKPTARSLAEADAEIAVGDLAVPAAIDDAMTDVSAVVLVSPAVPAQELNVVASAAKAGVAHVVKATSKASPDSPIARRHGQSEIEADLAASGIPYTLLRSNAYMQNILALAPAIAATSSFGSAAGKGRTGMVDARDIAAVAAQIAASPTAHAGKTYRLTGPELLSNYDPQPPRPLLRAVRRRLRRRILLDPPDTQHRPEADNRVNASPRRRGLPGRGATVRAAPDRSARPDRRAPPDPA